MSIKNVVEGSKSIWSSKTVWLAVAQTLFAVVGVWQGVFPQWGGGLLVAKSVLDLILRWLTDKPVTF